MGMSVHELLKMMVYRAWYHEAINVLHCSNKDHIDYITGIGNSSREQYIRVVQSVSP